MQSAGAFVFTLDKHCLLIYHTSMNNELPLIPNPQHAVVHNGICRISCSGIPFVSDSFYKEDELLACSILKNSGLICFPSGKDNFSGPFIEITRRQEAGSYSLADPESYSLEITAEKITISASGTAGAFYGIQTLRQLVMTYKNTLPCLFIYDKPAYSWRGFLLDTSRSFYSVDFIKKMIDLSAFHKLNRFHWHLTDDQGWRLPVPEYPLLTRIGSKRWNCNMPVREPLPSETRREYYTDDEITSVVHYAAERHIILVPEVELPGHASALLAAYPEFGCTGGPYKVESCWGIFSDVLCAGNDRIFDLYDSIFSTLTRLFPGKWIHIGGDECAADRWKTCPKCRQRIKTEGLDNTAQLQSWVTEKMAALVLSHGKIPIGWDEILDNTDKKPLPESVIVQSWRGIDGGKKAAELRHNVIMSPQTMCYMNLQNYDSVEEPGRLGYTTTQKAYSYSPVPQDLAEEYIPYILGGESALWSEELPSSKTAEYLLFPRFCALAECMWLPQEKKDFTRFMTSWNEHKKRLTELQVLYYDGKLA